MRALAKLVLVLWLHSLLAAYSIEYRQPTSSTFISMSGNGDLFILSEKATENNLTLHFYQRDGWLPYTQWDVELTAYYVEEGFNVRDLAHEILELNKPRLSYDGRRLFYVKR